MEDINWSAFKAKFDGKEQKSFERLSYLLFCDEFNKPLGLFRYKNQAGIETEPVEVDGKNIGFQAKFYETSLASNKAEIIDALKKAKDKNSELNKVIFYTNQEFAESSKKNKKEPDYKVEIENYAKSLVLEIEWRTKSYFESSHVSIKNKNIAHHYFSLEKSTLDLVTELTQHSDSIISPIHSLIEFNNQEIKIQRAETLAFLIKKLKDFPLVILSGEGGSGKTAIIKDFYDAKKNESPIFIFKATEFNISNINLLFKNYGEFTLASFNEELSGYSEKFIVIDSAEKLSDIEDTQAFQEFLTTTLSNKWKIIFTTRYNYLDDLKFQLTNIYGRNFHLINIENLDQKALSDLASKYGFKLPQNDKFIDLIKNPFYLNEYLQNYTTLGESTNPTEFKELIWNKQILGNFQRNNTHIKREEVFLKIAEKRANDTSFFVNTAEFDSEILHKLESDELIKHDPRTGGYFITHDIYEEWALNKIIDREFYKNEDKLDFLKSIGISLPVRRAFRIWLSEKLAVKPKEIESFIDTVIKTKEIEPFWKDESIISVLLSDYAQTFFELYEQKILANDYELLVRIIFLLRIACKEIDETLLHLLGLQKTDGIALKTIFTKPKGAGWNCVISLIFKHKEELGLTKMFIITSLLADWNSKFKRGNTTKNASLIALYLYEQFMDQGGYWSGSRDDKKEEIVNVILQGSAEIKEELKKVFDTVIAEKQTSHRDKYYPLVEVMLGSISSAAEITMNLPEYVIKIADLYWYRPPVKELNPYEHHSIGVEQHFGLSEMHDFNYFPPSALQTPTFLLLRYHPQLAVNFILSFTNKTAECYSKSEFGDEVEEVEIFFDESSSIKQLISNRLWNMYRGTQVSTSLLESIHMALEKWLLEFAKIVSGEVLESWCLYLLKNSKSASITAVVTSVVLANPDKLSKVAIILFRSRKLFFYDTGRYSLDQTASFQYSIGSGLGHGDMYRNERIKTCEDPHRKQSLEYLAVNYQFFRSDKVDEKTAENRLKEVWDVIDKHYSELPDEQSETSEDKTWRLYLARMDKRKMNPKLERKDGQVLIKFNPKIEPKLRKYSEDSLKKGNEASKYVQLKLWSSYRFEYKKEEYEKYEKYQDNPTQVISDVKKIVSKIKRNKDDNFSLLNRTIPVFSCAVLVRDYFDQLSPKDKEYCKKILLEFAFLPLNPQYRFQISDGVEPAIASLPLLIKNFPSDRTETKALLLMLLVSSWGHIEVFVIKAILHQLWKLSFKDAQSLLFGYILLKPKYDLLREELRKESYKNYHYEDLEPKLMLAFTQKYEKESESVVVDAISYKDLEPLADLENDVLNTIFELIPLRTSDEEHKKIIGQLFPIFSKKMFKERDGDSYQLRQRFFEKMSYFLLTSSKDELHTHLIPFIENFTLSRETADFFQALVFAEDSLNEYENFWTIWNNYYDKLKDACQAERPNFYLKEIIRNYLLAGSFWKEEAKEWHSLKDREKSFFSNVANEMGKFPTTLYSISKLLNEIGSKFLDDSIYWIATIIDKNPELTSADLDTNTIYYLENLIRKHILVDRQSIKRNTKEKKAVISILNFLVEHGSPTGYLLREDIL